MRRSAFIWFGAALLAVAVAYLLRAERPGLAPEPQRDEEVGVGPASAENATSGADTEALESAAGVSGRPARAAAQRASIIPLYAAISARDLLDAATRIGPGRPDALIELQVAAQHCSSLEQGRTPEEWYAYMVSHGVAPAGEAGRRNYIAYREMLATYCDGVGAEEFGMAIEHAREAGQASVIDPDQAFLQSLGDADDEVLADSSTQETLWRIASQTDSADVMYRALDLAAISAVAPPFAAFDRSLPDGINELRRVELRRLAVRHAICTWTRGCGPGSLQVLASCTYFGRCAPGLGWSDTVRGIYTDREVESIEALSGSLLQRIKPTQP